MRRAWCGAPLALGLLLLLSGCASTVPVTSDPPGAMVRARGSGRASYRWRTVGLTPCEFTVPYSAVVTYVQWRDGTQSEQRRIPLSNWRDPAPVHFEKPVAVDE